MRALGEQVTTLPLRGDVGVAEVFQPRDQDLLAQVLGEKVFKPAVIRTRPIARQQANHRLAAVTGLPQRLLPLLTRPQPRLGADVDEDLGGQLGSHLAQPLHQRDRLPVVGTRMTQEDARHNLLPARHPPTNEPAKSDTTRPTRGG